MKKKGVKTLRWVPLTKNCYQKFFLESKIFLSFKKWIICLSNQILISKHLQTNIYHNSYTYDPHQIKREKRKQKFYALHTKNTKTHSTKNKELTKSWNVRMSKCATRPKTTTIRKPFLTYPEPHYTNTFPNWDVWNGLNRLWNFRTVQLFPILIFFKKKHTLNRSFK